MPKLIKPTAPGDIQRDQPDSSADQPSDRATTAEPADTWLDDRVRALYESVLEEPLPDDMLSRLRKQTH